MTQCPRDTLARVVDAADGFGPASHCPETAVVADVSADSQNGRARKKGVSALRAPEQWLYRFYAADGELLYIGVSGSLGKRFSTHQRQSRWWPDVAQHTVEAYATRADVLSAERHAIAQERPRYNVAHASVRARGTYGGRPSAWDVEEDWPALIDAAFYPAGTPRGDRARAVLAANREARAVPQSLTHPEEPR